MGVEFLDRTVPYSVRSALPHPCEHICSTRESKKQEMRRDGR